MAEETTGFAAKRYVARLMSALVALALLYFMPAGQADEQHPLAPVDTSSPRATLLGFLTEVDRVWEIYRDQYWHSPSKELNQKIFLIAARALRTLDLSEVAPSARNEVGYDAGTFLYETLSRIELPPIDEIPDASAFEDTEGPAEWTIPRTDITIARVEEGPREGEFLFSTDTVARAQEFYLKTRGIPYQREVPIENSDKLRQYLPGWWISMATIDRLPHWARTVFFDQAVWKWLAFIAATLVFFAAIYVVHRLSRTSVHDNAVRDYLHRLVVPVFLLLTIPFFVYVVTEQINLIGLASKAVLLTSKTIEYLVATWLAWLAPLLLAEMAIRSPRVGSDSLNAQLLRLTARIVGIILGLVIIFYGANQIGIPLVGVLAGVGVSGLAIALAAQDSLKNLLGSLMIFMDQPYKPGQRIVVQGHDGWVEQIGLRSTKIRMLDGALTSIPNEKMASLDIENIGRREFIRRQTSIRLAYDTPPENVEKAIEIIKDILQDHEGMREELPPRVFFNEFNPDSLNIQLSYWYHPPRRWKSLAFDEQVNLQIMRRFADEGIQFAIPASKTYLTSGDASVQISAGSDAPATQ